MTHVISFCNLIQKLNSVRKMKIYLLGDNCLKTFGVEVDSENAGQKVLQQKTKNE